MPNGIETELDIKTRLAVTIGNGSLSVGDSRLELGPVWNPVPSVRFGVVARPALSAEQLWARIGHGPGLTPLGDDILAGYLAGIRLFDNRGTQATFSKRPTDVPDLEDTTSLSSTLTRLASSGEVVEPVHMLLESGDPTQLLAWGQSSGAGLLVGLGCTSLKPRRQPLAGLMVTLPFDPPESFEVSIVPADRDVPKCS